MRLGIIFILFLTSFSRHKPFYNKHVTFITEKKCYVKKKKLMTLWDGFPAGEGRTHLSLCPRGRALLCISGDHSSPSWRQTGCSPGNKAPELPAGSIRMTFFSFFMADICTNTACPFWSHSPRTSIWMLSSPAHLPDGSPYTPVSGSVWLGNHVSLKSMGAWRRKAQPILSPAASDLHPHDFEGGVCGHQGTWASWSEDIHVGGCLSEPPEPSPPLHQAL